MGGDYLYHRGFHDFHRGTKSAARHRDQKDIAILEQERAIYRARIEQDSTLLEELKYDDNLEQFASERYRMQRRGEKVYIVE